MRRHEEATRIRRLVHPLDAQPGDAHRRRADRALVGVHHGRPRQHLDWRVRHVLDGSPAAGRCH
eukprot:7229018-Heterocapsa_arctica.AAC.1